MIRHHPLRKRRSIRPAGRLLLAGLALACSTRADTFTWTGAVDDNWFEAGNWDRPEAPTNDAAVVFPAGRIVLTNATPALASFTMTGGTLVFSNWLTRVEAADVTLAAGTNTLPNAFSEADMSNRIWYVCSNFTLAIGAVLNADYLGYVTNHGPGKGSGTTYGSGAGYGGQGGFSQGGQVGGLAYGSIPEPTDPGSGASGTSVGGAGGGAVRIDATGGVAAIRGTITANGKMRTAIHAGSGSGGSILIRCRRFEGATNGLLSAKGGNGSNGGGSGGGGRLAVIYNPAAQAGHNPGVRFLADAGTGGFNSTLLGAGRGPQDGTLYLPDATFLQESLSNQFLGVRLYGPTSWAPAQVTVQATRLVLEETGFLLNAAGEVVIATNAQFGLGSNSVLRCQNLLLTNNGSLSIFAGPTNGAAANYGALISVTDTVWVASNAWIYPVSQEEDGGAPLLRMRDLLIANGGGVSAAARGYAREKGPGKGMNSGSLGSGGGHGGLGGKADTGASVPGPRNDSTNSPLFSGSGGGLLTWGGRGGGAVRLEVARALRLDGTLSADASSAVYTHGGGGAGGTLLVFCQELASSADAMLTARGGNGNNRGAGGGGGRIALWVRVPDPLRNAYLSGASLDRVRRADTHPAFLGTVSVTNGTQGAFGPPAEPGTAWFFQPLHAGAMLTFR